MYHKIMYRSILHEAIKKREKSEKKKKNEEKKKKKTKKKKERTFNTFSFCILVHTNTFL